MFDFWPVYSGERFRASWPAFYFIGVVWQSGHTWKVMRRFTLQTLRDFGVGKTSIEDKIFQEIDAASYVFQDTKGQATDVKQLTAMMISNVIYGIVFGKRYA